MEEIYIEVHVKLYKPIEKIAINFTVNSIEDETKNVLKTDN